MCGKKYIYYPIFCGSSWERASLMALLLSRIGHFRWLPFFDKCFTRRRQCITYACCFRHMGGRDSSLCRNRLSKKPSRDCMMTSTRVSSSACTKLPPLVCSCGHIFWIPRGCLLESLVLADKSTFGLKTIFRPQSWSKSLFLLALLSKSARQDRSVSAIGSPWSLVTGEWP